ncbi:MAG: type I-B CRISPR-associated protein Cas7/Cst2/DevR [Bacillota bacterium]
MKCISLTWLAQADLSNLNSGQGSGNFTELKTYDYGQKPYVSGQATRTALFDTIARTHPDKFICTPERPCADVENCWGCDLRGFLAPKEGVGGDRRWSPVKVTPGLGQLSGDITNDLLTRHSVMDKEGDKQSKDNRIAHVQMTENIYKFGLVIDVENVGKIKVPITEGKGKEERVVDWKVEVDIGEEARKERIKTLLDGVYNLSGFAKQARAAASLAPDVLLVTVQDTYNQRGLKALELAEDGHIKEDLLDYYLAENLNGGNKIFFGMSPGLAKNEQQVKDIFKKYGVEVLRVSQVIDKVRELL